MRLAFTLISLLLAIGALKAQPQQALVLQLHLNGAIYVPNQDRIYVTTRSGGANGNSICRINPYTGSTEACFFIGSEPGPLAVSAGGEYLYVGLNTSPQVKRFNLSTNSVDQTINLGGDDDFLGPFYAEDMEVAIDDPRTIIVSLRNSCCSPRHEGVAVFRNGVMAPDRTQDHTGANRITSTGTANLLYGYNNETTEFGLRELRVTPNGIEQGNVYFLIDGFGTDIEFADNRIYASSGQVVDLSGAVPVQAGFFTDPDGGFSHRAIESAPDSNVVYTISLRNGGYVLKTYNKETFNLVDEAMVATFAGEDVRQLLHWGRPDRLAFTTALGHLVLLRTCVSALTEAPPILTPLVGGCDGEAVTLTAADTSSLVYWSNGQTGPTARAEHPGYYTYALADSTGCLGPASAPIQVTFDHTPSAPSIEDAQPRVLCQSGSATLRAIPPGDGGFVVWNTGDTTLNLVVTTAGTYTARYITVLGCASSTSVPVVVTAVDEPAPAPPAISPSGTIDTCGVNQLIISAASGYARYRWSNGVEAMATILYAHASQEPLSVIGFNASGCASDPSEWVKVNFYPVPPQPFIQVNTAIHLLASSAAEGNQWFLNGQPIPGATGQFYTPAQSGFYSVQVTVLNCTSPMSDLVNFILTATDDPAAAAGIRLYPNPGSGPVYVQLEAPETLPARGAQWYIYDATGRLLARAPLLRQEQQQLAPFERLPAGIYQVKLHADSGDLLGQWRVARR